MATTTSTTSTTTQQNDNNIIHIVGSLAPLFGGSSLSDCSSITDPTCVTGGAATVVALARHLAANGRRVLVPFLDKHSQFAQSHPLGWTVNRLIWQYYFQTPFYTSTSALLLQDGRDFAVSQHDLRGLQTKEWPLILTNADVPPGVSWHSYVQRVGYHRETELVLFNIMGLTQPLSVHNPIDAVKAALDDVARKNEESGCTQTTGDYEEYLVTHNMQHQQQQSGSSLVVNMMWNDDNQNTNATSTTTPTDENNKVICWKAAIYFSDQEPTVFAELVEALRWHHNPPPLIIDGGANAKEYEQAKLLETPNAPAAKMWVQSLPFTYQAYYQTTMVVSSDRQWLDAVSSTVVDMAAPLPEAVMQDPQYATDFEFVHALVREAEQHDPVMGQSLPMPVSRVNDYRRCKGGECELGNLFADALRWKSGADVAFITSGGLRGSGWEAGNVTVSQIWASLPFPNTICEGIMTGINLFKIVDYAFGVATFESQETSEGGRLLQVSGMKIVYNTLLQKHRVISIDIWDNATKTFEPIERLKLYKFATDSFLCGAYVPFPIYLGPMGLTLEGEVPGRIGDDLHQNMVGEYLQSFGDEPYHPALEGRLVNDTTAMTPLNLIQTQEGCPPQTYWVDTKASCVNCPNSSHVSFSDETLEFVGESGLPTLYPGRILLVNREQDAFHVVQKSTPEWLEFVTTQEGEANVTQQQLTTTNTTTSDIIDTGAPITLLNPGDSLVLDFVVSAKNLATGTASGTVSFGVLDGSGLVGCVDNNDATFDVILRVAPGQDLNQLGNMMYFGLVLMAIAILTAFSAAIWTARNRQVRIVKTMQPLFLKMICAGVMVMALSMGSLSLDDGLVSQRWCDFACMSMPWFVSMGWTITFAAIHAKLWRINKLFNRTSGFRRVTVSERDALVFFTVLFGLNFVILLLWSLLDPLEWDRLEVPGEEWNTYGTCGSGAVGDAFMGLAVAVNVGTLCLATYQAYHARNISGEFSESKKLGLAVYTWLQMIAVGLPVLFLIDREDVIARYFLTIALIFCLCITMVLNIFVPMILHKRKLDMNADSTSKSNVRVSGLNPSNVPTERYSNPHSYGGVPSYLHDSNISNPSSMPIASNSKFHDSMLSSGTSLSGGDGGQEQQQQRQAQPMDDSMFSSTNEVSQPPPPPSEEEAKDDTRRSFHGEEEDVTFHDEQEDVSFHIDDDDGIVLQAPTVEEEERQEASAELHLQSEPTSAEAK